MTLGTRLYAAAETDNLRITLGVSDTLTPLDVDGVLRELGVAEQRIRGEVARLKFVHDLKLLRTALYCLGTAATLEDGRRAIEEDQMAEDQANALLHGYLAAQGWRSYEPLDGTTAVFSEKPGRLTGPRVQVDIGKKYSGDVIVSLDTGRTLVAVATSAYLFDWVEVPLNEKHTPAPQDRWWFVRNYLDKLGHDPHGEKRREVREALTVPGVPANLDAMIHRINTEH